MSPPHRTTLAIALLFLTGAGRAGGQYLRVITGTSTVVGQDVAVDAADNVYVTGGFGGNAIFDAAGASLASVGLKDVFLASYDAAGALRWHFGVGGVLGGPGLDDEGMAVSVSPAGDVYVAGYFRGEADFDPGPGEARLMSAGFRDAFVASYTAEGAFRWARRFGGAADDMALGIHAGDDEAVYVTGLFRGEATLEPGGGDAVASQGQEDGFLVALGHDGALRWIIPYGGPSVDAGRDVGADADGNVYLLGHFSGRVDFARNSTAGDIDSLNDSQDAVLASYTPDGGFRWAFPLGGPQADGGLGLAVDAAGNGYVTGHFVGRMDFDPDDFNEFELTSAGASDLYLARYTAAGGFVWARQAGSGFARGADVAVSPAGPVYVTGFFSGTIFPDPQSTFSLTSIDEQDVILASYDPAGAFRWAGGIGGSFAEFGTGVAANAAGQVFLTGFFESDTDFDPGEGALVRTSGGDVDAFVVRYEVDGTLAVSVEPAPAAPESFMDVYPNPAWDRIHVVLPRPNADVQRLELVDALGRRVRVVDGLAGRAATVTLDVHDLPAGVYVVRIIRQAGVASRSVVVSGR